MFVYTLGDIVGVIVLGTVAILGTIGFAASMLQVYLGERKRKAGRK